MTGGRQEAAQRLRCFLDGCDPTTANGPIPGAWCSAETGDVFSYCDDGEGYCPTPDCKYYGTCTCICHQEQQ